MIDLQGKRAARLLRVSSRGQDEDNQDKPTADYVTERGMVPAKTYKLKGKSARKAQQVAAVREAITAAERGEFDVLVIRAIDRLDRRGARHGWALLGELMDAGVTVLSVADPELERIDTDPMAEAIVGFKLSVARQEVDDKIRRLDDTFRRMDAEGSFRGTIPAGYVTTGEKYRKRLVPDVTGVRGYTSAAIADVIRTAATGVSATRIGQQIGMLPESAAKLIRNEIYSTGVYKVRRKDGVTVQVRTEPLVTPDEQARAIATLDSRKFGANAVSSRAIRTEDFSGAMWCGVCEMGRMYRYFNGTERRKDGTLSPRVRRYHCRRRECGKSVRAEDCDAVIDALMSGRQTPWFEVRHIPGNDHAAELERVQIELRELPGRGLDDDSEDAERGRLRAERKRLDALPRIAPRTERHARGTEGAHWAELDMAGRREWLLAEEFRLYVKAAAKRTGAVIVELEYLADDETG